uniref:Rx N-terminal domain-containing protein n=1 Tax=Oryza meridionalis TaxID=40149 RepID=A0A0E0EVK6_9ORYZ
MSRRPYDAYLYIDNFMFGRHTEKQKLLNFLLEYNSQGLPPVLPIIGSLAVGKKTLVAHVCADERVQSQFSSILHLNEDDLLRLAHSDTLLSGKMLVVVEFVSDLNEKNWEEFYTSLTQMTQGSKVITISRFRKSEKLGTVKPILLDIHSYEELSYLFKTLAFGSANPRDHPRLLQIAEEFAMQLQLKSSLVAANFLADVLRRNLDVNFWLCMLNRCITVAEKNFSLYGEHTRLLLEQGHRVDITNFDSSPAAPLHVVPCIGANSTGKDLPRVKFTELLLDPSVRPKGEKKHAVEPIVSAVVGDFVYRFISYLFKCESQENLETKMERLHNLLLKAHMIVEEAEGRYITNSKMLLQFKKIVETMYQGYHILDIIKHRTLCSSRPEEEVSSSNTLSTRTCYVDPFRTSQSYTIRHDQLQSTLDSLETIVSSMTEFVILLGGCERMSPKPYDTYLYFDNFMYGRQVEKQQVISILLQENIPHFAPTVLPRSLALVELVREL